MPRSPRPSGRSRLGALAGWTLVLPSATVALARLSGHEKRQAVLAAEAVTPLLAAPTLAAAVFAAATGRRLLAAVAGTLAAGHLAWARADLGGPRPLPAGAADRARFRLFCANILFVNTDMNGIAAEIAAAEPDVVVLQEVSPANLGRLEASGVLEGLPHRLVTPRPDALGTGIFSRLPLEDAEDWRVAGHPMARATVVVGDRRLRLYNVHTRAPTGPGGPPLWNAQLAGLRQAAAAETMPVVMAGDFNATSGHRGYRALAEAGLRDAHVERGRWWAVTWPTDLRFLPPLMRLDNVLVSAEVAVVAVREGEGRGSDHRPVVCDLAVVG